QLGDLAWLRLECVHGSLILRRHGAVRYSAGDHDFDFPRAPLASLGASCCITGRSCRTRRDCLHLGLRSYMRRTLALLVLLASSVASAQERTVFTRADSLRGTNSPLRSWWDVTFYDLHVRISPSDSTIRGWNGITYRVVRPGREMQIDLQPPLVIDSMVQDGQKLAYRRDSMAPPRGRGGRGSATPTDTAVRPGNAWFVTLPAVQPKGVTKTLTIWYHGAPRVAI